MAPVSIHTGIVARCCANDSVLGTDPRIAPEKQDYRNVAWKLLLYERPKYQQLRRPLA
jgi:hypothetical protein